MLRSLRFAFTYAVRNMWRDNRRTLFALISIAAGVAAVVALRALGLMLTDALTANAQATLRGDVFAGRTGGVQVSILGTNSRTQPVDTRNIDDITAWAARNGYEITFALTSELMQTAVVTQEGEVQRAGRPGFVVAHFIDPQVYPFYDVIRAEDPPGALLSTLFTGPNQVVVGRRIADQIGIKVGNKVRVGAAKELHTVTGIVPDAAESSVNNPNALLFSFVYLNRAQLADFGLEKNAANEVFLKVPAGTDLEYVVSRIRAEWPTLDGRRFQTNTAERVLQNNTIVADALSRFVLLTSLVGLVIGGVGIINTMIVSVNRRSVEIAVLKTLGLKGGRVSLIFLIEAILIGILGSLLGGLIGIFLSLIARDFGQQAFGIALPWRLYADPLVIGVLLGVAITVFFSFLPTLMARSVRPGLVLRQGNIPLARAGLLPSLAALILLIVGLGVMVDLIINSPQLVDRFEASSVGRRVGGFQTPFGLSPGILGTAVVFLLLGLTLSVMWVLVWLLSKLPSFRNPTMRMAVRGLTTHRWRTSLSLLALIIGMTALSGTLIMGRSINTLVYTSISEPIGGNVIVLPLLPVGALVRAQLDTLDGVNGYRDVRFAAARLLSIGGTPFREGMFGNDGQAELLEARLSILIGMNVYGNPKRGTLVEGRFLTPQDAGKNYIVIPYDERLAALGVKVGSKLTYRVSSQGDTPRDIAFEVVGVVAPDARSGFVPFSLSDSAVVAPLATLPSVAPFDLIVADVREDMVSEVMGRVGALPGIFVFDISFFDSILTRLFTQIAALPLLVAGLSLFAAAALIATTVSLATMERRRQIGILKAVGVKRRQVLAQLLIENGLVGLMGGFISILPTLLILAAVPALTEGIVRLPVPADLIGLMLALSVGITLGATMLTAYSAASEPPLSVLRYE